jgi:hypothetical protein
MFGSGNWKRFAIRCAATLVGMLAMTSALTIPAEADVARTTQWVCQVPEEDGSVTEVVFVSAPPAAAHGITQANSTAGETFAQQFGESCIVR